MWRADRLSSSGNDNLRQVESLDEAILVASRTESGLHAPALDLDYTCNLYTLDSWNVLEFGMLACVDPIADLAKMLDAFKNAELLAPIAQPITRTRPEFRFGVALNAPVRLLQSSSMNHHHAYIDREITWKDYVWILDTMQRCQLINIGFRKFSIQREMTMLLVPGLTKDMLAARGVEVVNNKS